MLHIKTQILATILPFTKWRILAAILFLLFFLILYYVLANVIESVQTNDELKQSRSIQTNAFNYNLSGIPSPSNDIKLDLMINYTHGTLTVDEPVEISGRAILLSPRSKGLIDLEMAFENAMAYPVSKDIDGITNGGGIRFYRTQNRSIWEGKTTIFWTLEGTYQPKIAATSINPSNNSLIDSSWARSPEVTITVNSKSQISQMVTNTAMLYLTIAIFLLTIVGSIPIFSNLWNKNQPHGNNNTHHNQTKKKG